MHVSRSNSVQETVHHIKINGENITIVNLKTKIYDFINDIMAYSYDFSFHDTHVDENAEK